MMDKEELLSVISYAQSEISQILSICAVMGKEQRKKLRDLNKYLYEVVEQNHEDDNDRLDNIIKEATCLLRDSDDESL